MVKLSVRIDRFVGLVEKAIHFTSVDHSHTIIPIMRSAPVGVIGVVKWDDLFAVRRVDVIHSGWKSIGAGICPEIVVE